MHTWNAECFTLTITKKVMGELSLKECNKSLSPKGTIVWYTATILYSITHPAGPIVPEFWRAGGLNEAYKQ